MRVLIEHDKVLERWARQIEHPKGVGPTEKEFRTFLRVLGRFEVDVREASSERPEALGKHAALMTRGRKLLSRLSQPDMKNVGRSGLSRLEPELRWLQNAEGARVGKMDSGAALQSVCARAREIGPEIGLGAGLVFQLTDDREQLLRFVPPDDGRYRVDTLGSRTDTTLQVLDSCAGEVLAAGDDEIGLRARAQFDGVEAEPVWIRVGSDRAGIVQLSVHQLTQGVGTAAISGTVRDRETRDPVEGVRVRLLSAGGAFFEVFSSADGSYLFEGLLAGTHSASTLGGGYPSTEWPEPITLAEGEVRDDVNFDLVPYSSLSMLSGRVYSAETGEPLSFLTEVELERLGSTWSRTEDADASGRFQFEHLEPGEYVLWAVSYRHYPKLYDDIYCGLLCDPSDGTPVVVAADSDVTGIEMHLDPYDASIGGTVSEAASGLPPAPRADIKIYDSDGELVGQTNTTDGEFSVPVPAPNTYFAVATAPPAPLAGQVWQGLDCLTECDPLVGDPIPLAAGEHVEIEFDLLGEGWIDGRVRAADSGDLGGFVTTVSVFDSSGNFVVDAFTDQFGAFRIDDLAVGDYYVIADNEAFRSEIFDDVACGPNNVCDPLLGSAVTVIADASVPNVDFALARLGVIAGRVTRQGTTDPVVGITLIAEEAPGTAVPGTSKSLASVEATTNGTGDYRFEGLEPDSYVVWTSSIPWADEAYDDLPCEPDCDLSLATPISASIGSAQTGIDFGLQKKGWIQGRVIAESTSLPIANRPVLALDGDMNLVRSGTTDANGEYIIDGLEDGSYGAVVLPDPAHLGELFDDVPCRYLGTSSYDCELSEGDLLAVSVESGATADFELAPAGVIAGTVRGNHNSVISGSVRIYDTAGVQYGSTSLDFSSVASYQIGGLPAGDYHVFARSSRHQDEFWPDQPCDSEGSEPDCPLNSGSPVSVSTGDTTWVDFELEPYSRIRGQAIDMETGESIRVQARIYDANETLVASSAAEDTAAKANFIFQVFTVPPGTYYVETRTGPAPYYLKQIYGGDTCDPDCEISSGTPIEVLLGVDFTELVVPMVMGPGVRGKVIDGATGAPIPDVIIDAWREEGGNGGSAVAVTDELGEFRLSLAARSYFFSTYNELGLVDFIYGGPECPEGSAWEGTCDPTEGAFVEVEADKQLRQIHFAFGDATIVSDGFESGDTTGWSSAVGAD